MKTTTLFTERMSQAFTPGPTGFVRLVDDLLEIARDWELRLYLNERICRVQAGRAAEGETFEAPMWLGDSQSTGIEWMRKSVDNSTGLAPLDCSRTAPTGHDHFKQP